MFVEREREREEMKRERERERESVISLTFSHWQRSKFPYGCADVAKE